MCTWSFQLPICFPIESKLSIFSSSLTVPTTPELLQRFGKVCRGPFHQQYWKPLSKFLTFKHSNWLKFFSILCWFHEISAIINTARKRSYTLNFSICIRFFSFFAQTFFFLKSDSAKNNCRRTTVVRKKNRELTLIWPRCDKKPTMIFSECFKKFRFEDYIFRFEFEIGLGSVRSSLSFDNAKSNLWGVNCHNSVIFP